MASKKITFLIIVFLHANVQLIYCQQTPYVGLIQDNWSWVNPAFLDHAYFENKLNTSMINFSVRDFHSEFGEKTSNLRFEHVVTDSRLAGKKRANLPILKWGAGLTYDKIVPFRQMVFKGNIAKYWKLGSKWEFGLGLNAGLVRQDIQLEPSQFESWSGDQFAQNLNEKIQSWANADVGIIFRHIKEGNKFYTGATVSQIRALYSDSSSKIKHPIYYNLLLGYYFKAGIFYLEPTLWVRALPGITYHEQVFNLGYVSSDILVKCHINGFWVGTGIHTAKNLNAGFGYTSKSKNDKKYVNYKIGLFSNIPLSQSSLPYSAELFMGFVFGKDKTLKHMNRANK